MILQNKTIFDFTNSKEIIEEIKKRLGIPELSKEWYENAEEIVRLNHIGLLASITKNSMLLENVETDIKEIEEKNLSLIKNGVIPN